MSNREDAVNSERDPLSGRVIEAAIEVHRALGPGLLESAYRECLCHELALNGIAFKKEVSVPVRYKGVKLDCGYRLDILVEPDLILEIKSVDHISGLHDAQLLTYLRLTDFERGLLLNFNVRAMKDGIKRPVLSRK